MLKKTKSPLLDPFLIAYDIFKKIIIMGTGDGFQVSS